ncbi:DNA polymerase [Neptuniibacter sp. QD37_11]|uniref:DNA polymerase n=1 Tax=Neptuniibacter sp. QD37_11 TaxID=3398209 RepID=UPI0039F539C5
MLVIDSASFLTTGLSKEKNLQALLDAFRVALTDYKSKDAIAVTVPNVEAVSEVGQEIIQNISESLGFTVIKDFTGSFVKNALNKTDVDVITNNLQVCLLELTSQGANSCKVNTLDVEMSNTARSFKGEQLALYVALKIHPSVFLSESNIIGLLDPFKDIETSLKGLEEVSGREARIAQHYTDDLERSARQMLRFASHQPPEQDLPDVKRVKSDNDSLYTLLGDNGLVDLIPNSHPLKEKYEIIRRGYVQVDSDSALESAYKSLIDSETVCVSSYEANNTCYLAVMGDSGVSYLIDLNKVNIVDTEFANNLLYNEQVRKVGHYTIETRRHLRPYSVDLSRLEFISDSYVAGTLLNYECSEAKNPLDAVAVFGFEQELAAGDFGKRVSEEMRKTLSLNRHLYKALSDQGKLFSLFKDVEMPCTKILAEVESAGLKVDRIRAMEMSEVLDRKIQKMSDHIKKHWGHAVDVTAENELAEFIYDTLKLTVPGQKEGNRSVKNEFLEILEENNSLIAKIREYKSLFHALKSKMGKELLPVADNLTDRVHTHFDQLKKTGRISSYEPAMQNMPNRDQGGRAARTLIIPDAGNKLIAGDYSQMELGILAELSEDPALIQAFKDGVDLHKMTAAEVFGVPFDQVTGEQRRYAKAINFGLIYGMSEYGLSKQLDISTNDAKSYINQYFDRFPTIKGFIEKTKAFCRENGYVETFYGRRCFYPDINSKDRRLRERAERQCVNAVIQGTAADIVKIAMVKTCDVLDKNGLSDVGARMVMQVHDELIFEVPSSVAAQAVPIITNAMESASSFELKVDLSVGDNLKESHDLELSGQKTL